MAHEIKGEVSFQADGRDYTLLLDFNALCELEDIVPGVMEGNFELKSPKVIRAVFHAGLVARHAALSLEDAGRIISAVGMVETAQLLGRAMEASFGKSEGGDEKRPQTKAAGAGSKR